MYYIDKTRLPKDGYYLKVAVMKNKESDSFMIRVSCENELNIIKGMVDSLKEIKEAYRASAEAYKNTLENSKYFKDRWEYEEDGTPCRLLGYGVYYCKDGIRYKKNKLSDDSS